MTLTPATYLSPPPSLPPVLPVTTIKARPEDFQVEEIPAYSPCGSGEHLFLWIEKQDVSAGFLMTLLSRMLGIKDRDIGVAGQKDRRAITRQFVSVPAVMKHRVVSQPWDGIRVLEMTAHENKLRTGHVNGNHFRVVLRDAEGNSFSTAQATAVSERLTQLAETGFPNYFGPQRFGHHGNSVRDGLAMLAPESGSRKVRVKRHLKKLLASAVQSAVFNEVLARRVRNGSFRQPISGDVVCRRDGIRPFMFDDRGDTNEEILVPMGPLPGAKSMLATGAVLEQEREVLAHLGLAESTFLADAKLTPGARRRLVDFPIDTSAALLDDGSIETRFTLSAGCYATVLLAEVCQDVAG